MATPEDPSGSETLGRPPMSIAILCSPRKLCGATVWIDENRCLRLHVSCASLKQYHRGTRNCRRIKRRDVRSFFRWRSVKEILAREEILLAYDVALLPSFHGRWPRIY